MEKESKYMVDSLESQLIASVKEGNVKSFEMLFNKYYARFYRFILGFVKDEDTAQDIAQNIFIKVWTHRETLEPEKSMNSYLYVLSKYEIYNHFRAKHNTCVEYISESTPLAIPSTQNIEEEYNVSELRTIIKSTVDDMPEKRRMIFKMSRYDYLSVKEIAERLGLSTRTVEKHIELALRDLRSKLSPFYFILFILFSNRLQ